MEWTAKYVSNLQMKTALSIFNWTKFLQRIIRGKIYSLGLINF